MEAEVASNVAWITQMFQMVVQYVDTVVGGNEFASGLLLTGMAGTGMYFLRTVPRKIYEFAVKHTTTTLVLHSSAESFHQFSKYCRDHGIVKQSRYLRFNNGLHGYDDTVKELGLGTQILWFGLTPLLVSREEMNSDSRQAKEVIRITRLGRSHDFFDQMLKEIRRSEDEIEGTRISEMDGEFTSFIVKQPHRQMDTVALPDKDIAKLKKAIDQFRQNEQWYIDHGIPYQLGILLYGPPGTGKTSLIKAIATYADLDIVIAPTASALVSASKRASNCVIACEEVDVMNVGKRNTTKERIGNDNADALVDISNDTADHGGNYESLSDAVSKMRLGEVLNALDGIVMSHGRIMVFTTNHIEELDAAMMRPGRIDLKMHVGYLTDETFNKMIGNFYPGHKYRYIDIKHGVSPAELQNDIRMGMSVDELYDKYSHGERHQKIQGHSDREPVAT